MHPIDRLLYGKILSKDPEGALRWIRFMDNVSLAEECSLRIHGKVFPYTVKEENVTDGYGAAERVERFNPRLYGMDAALRERAAVFYRRSQEETVKIRVLFNDGACRISTGHRMPDQSSKPNFLGGVPSS